MKKKIPFKQILDKTNDVVLITEVSPLDGPTGPKIVYANQAFYHLTEFTPEEIIGKTPRILQGPKTNKKNPEKNKHALIEEKSIRVSLLNYTKSGSEYWLDCIITPLYDEAGKLIFFAAIERDVTSYKAMQETLYQLATTDFLTKIFNRRRFLENFDETLSDTQDKKSRHALLIVDLDDFKKLNDEYGHLVGDKALCNIAKICQSICRESDYVCRYGGDEFLVLLQNTARAGALRKASEICDAVRKKLTPKGSVSIGVTMVTNKDKCIDDAIKRADQALYQAKAKGKNTAHFK